MIKWIGVLLAAMGLAGCSSATHVTQMRCEYLNDPLGIDVAGPRLSWQMESSRRGVMQSAYQVRVGSSPEKLKSGEADLWDSGKVESNQSAQVEYRGKKLKTGERCYWTVRVWDQEGHESNGDQNWWEMGLLEPGDWKPAKWIGMNELVGPAPMLRKGFEVSGEVKRARVYICGLGYYELHLNGAKVGDHVLDPGYTDYDRRALYVTYDVTKQLREGGNALGVILGTGWYDVHTLAVWDFDKAPWRAAPKALVRLEVEYADGRKETVVSDGSWKAATGPITFDSIYGGEFYDARLEKKGWDEPGFDDAGWKDAAVVDGPRGKLTAQEMPPIRVTQEITPKSVKEVKPGVWMMDMGQNFAGVPKLMVKGEAGKTVAMRCGERVKEDGTLETSQIDVFVRQRGAQQVFQEDRYTLKGTGAVETYVPRFTYHGFQYVEVTGFPGVPTVENFRGMVMHSDVDSAGSFECSNELLNKIWRAARWSYLSNLMSIPTDCPTREKNGWTGDAHLAAETGLYNFHAAAVYTKWMKDIEDAQRPDGELPGIVPSGGWGYVRDIGPAWDTVLFQIPWEMHLFEADRRIYAQHYDAMKRYLDWLAANRQDGIIQFGLGDWAPYEAQTPPAITGTAYLYRDAVILSEAAKLLGKEEDARKYDELASATKEAFNRKFFDAKKDEYLSGTQTALSCALYQGLVPAGHERGVFENLVRGIEVRKDHLDCGILGTKYVMNVLLDFGRADLALRIAEQTDLPSWGYWIQTKGATTLYESWKDVDSRNHIMFGDVAAWFVRGLAGIRPEEAGFARVTIRPQVVGDLSHVSASFDSIHGKIASAWRKEAGKVYLDVAVPANVTATVWVPTRDVTEVTESDGPVNQAAGVKYLRVEDGAAAYAVESGVYHFAWPQRQGG